jgi:HAD superfamily phosphatase (TIGR01668 family)
MGIDAVLLDVDCTLKSYRAAEVSPEVKAWLDELQASGIGICLVSNGRGKRIGRLAGALGLPFVSKAMKPLPCGCRRAVRQEAFDARRTAMIGDQIFADISAGRLAGLTSILVRPIRPEEEPWFTQLKRPLERFLLRRLDAAKDRQNNDVKVSP